MSRLMRVAKTSAVSFPPLAVQLVHEGATEDLHLGARFTDSALTLVDQSEDSPRSIRRRNVLSVPIQQTAQKAVKSCRGAMPSSSRAPQKPNFSMAGR